MPEVDLPQRIEILGSVPPFSVLDGGGLQDLASNVSSASFRTGDVIFREGETADACFVVTSGHVRVSVHGPTQRRRMIGVVGPKQVFGVLGVVDHGPRVMDAEAIEDCRLLAVSAELFWRTVETHVAFARRVIELIGQRLRRADDAMRDLVFYDASARLARRLLDLAEAHGRTSETGVLIEARMTQSELAQMAGMSRASVSLLLITFAREGWVDWNDGMPILLRPDLLLGHAGEVTDVPSSPRG